MNPKLAADLQMYDARVEEMEKLIDSVLNGNPEVTHMRLPIHEILALCHDWRLLHSEALLK